MALIFDYQNGSSIVELQERYKISVSSIYNYIRLHNTSKRKRKRTGTSAEIAAYYNSGKTRRQTAAKFGLSTATLPKVLKDGGSRIRTYPESRRKHRLNEGFFDKVDTQEKAYFLGILYADGSNSGNQITLSLKYTDEEILHKLRSVIDAGTPVVSKVDRSGYLNGSPQSRITFSSQGLCRRLSELGCTPRKSLSLTFPMFLTDELLPHFLRGYLDGDGWIRAKTQGLEVGMIGSISFIESAAQSIRQLCGVNVSTRIHHKSKKVAQLHVRGGNQARRLLSVLYEGATIYLERKRLLADSVISCSYYKKAQRRAAACVQTS